MQVKDVMTRNVISVERRRADRAGRAPDAAEPHQRAARPRCEGDLVGMVTEGDFLRRSELGTQRHRPKWLEFIVGPGRLAEEYVAQTRQEGRGDHDAGPKTAAKTKRSKTSSKSWSAITSSACR